METINRNEKGQTLYNSNNNPIADSTQPTPPNTNIAATTPNPNTPLTPPAPNPDPPKTKTKRDTFVLLIRYKINDKKKQYESLIMEKVKDKINSVNIPVGSVSVFFEYVLDFLAMEDDFTILGAVIGSSLKDNGFKILLDRNRVVLRGTPREDTDSSLDFYCCTDAKNSGQKLLSKPFVITPHPRNLWQNLPVTDYEGYPNNDSDASGATIEYLPVKKYAFETSPAEYLELIAASQRGRSHSHVGKPRDDCFQFDFDAATRWVFVSVADGAGSAKFSRKGSELACNTAIASLKTNLTNDLNASIERWFGETLNKREGVFDKPISYSGNDEVGLDNFGDIFHNAIYAAYKSIYDESQERKSLRGDAELKDYHTTLLCAVFRYFENFRCWFIASYWVGDGGAAILRGNGLEEALVLGEPDGGEFAGQTKFLTMKDEITAESIRKRLRFTLCETFDAMIFVTDGITDPFFPSESAVVDGKRWLEFFDVSLKSGCVEEPDGCPELFDETKEPQQKAEALLKWLDFWSKGNHDDRTILIVKNKDWIAIVRAVD
ncbi:MAG: protein phosphatase 2C domain-containing protein [Planctomycetaceae bacterium]|jgi:serine/threonine protein phosphatase PrpC|nr:protein phosphatase 2C domain-containing protein [Planctomycetaceae bacterium]